MSSPMVLNLELNIETSAEISCDVTSAISASGAVAERGDSGDLDTEMLKKRDIKVLQKAFWGSEVCHRPGCFLSEFTNDSQASY